jgi:signal transduction histidine kinase
VLGTAVLLFLRRRAIALQLSVLVATTGVAVVASMITVADQMFISAHDLTVAIYVAAIAGSVSLLISVLLGVVVSRNIRRLTAVARSIGHGMAERSTHRASSAELRALAIELGATSRRLGESQEREQRLEASRRALIAGISHDLRTPLAGIRAMSEALEDGLVDDQQRYLHQMRSKVEQLDGMVEDLFEVSKIDAGLLALNFTEVSLYDLASDAVADLGPLALDRSITVGAPNVADLTVRADARELSRAMSNLLSNAVQHTPAGTPIEVIASRRHDGRPSVSVIDQGGGIPENELDRVFEAGWRGQKSRSPHYDGRHGGAGLGLAIVVGILKAHHGEVTVRNVPGGCQFDLILPA